MTCFFACAFDRSDVDKMYRSVKRTLKSVGVATLRVDKINHNKKIDAKIIELINSCDFGIADLTYARPSVYYEAGRLHGLNKEVIFTARKDHFKMNPDDQFGNLRIHFDLVTENIVQWDKDLSVFERRLQARVKRVIQPIIKQQNDKKAVDKEQREFQRTPLSQRQDLARVDTFRFFEKSRFKMYPDRTWKVVGVSKNKAGTTAVMADFDISTTGREIKLMYNRSHQALSLLRGLRYVPTNVVILLVVISKVAEPTIHKALPWFSKSDSLLKEYHYTREGQQVRFILIDDIRSRTDLNERLGMIFSKK